ncbi:hypothetical protein GCM10009639_19100 [Kitasatospora putterlickiae]|uniref:Uncharacterized protein n=1 Tax=Kitasatospora putterlickiae TaxID=221725 RepID=A0ABP4IGQ0_9ACTN
MHTHAEVAAEPTRTPGDGAADTRRGTAGTMGNHLDINEERGGPLLPADQTSRHTGQNPTAPTTP